MNVKAKEKDLPSPVGAIGLPLSRNPARARIDIRPATSGHCFLPLAVRDFEITRVQVRHFDECRDPNQNSPLATKDLAPLPSPSSMTTSRAAEAPSGCYWYPGSNPAVGDKSRSFGVNDSRLSGRLGRVRKRAYLPVGVEVRIASQRRGRFQPELRDARKRSSSPTASRACPRSASTTTGTRTTRSGSRTCASRAAARPRATRTSRRSRSA